MEHVLEHDALDARRLVLAQPVGRLLDGADDCGLSRLPAREVGVAANAVAKVVLVGADDARRHDGEAERLAVGALAGLGHHVPPPVGLFRHGEGRVVLVGPADGRGDRPRLRGPADDDRRPRLLHRLRARLASGAPVLVDRRELTLELGHAFADRPNAKPQARCSASYQPAPIPSSTRPPETWSTVTTLLASTAAWRNVTGETSVPSRSRSVRAARAASVVHASSDPASPPRPIAR